MQSVVIVVEHAVRCADTSHSHPGLLLDLPDLPSQSCQLSGVRSSTDIKATRPRHYCLEEHDWHAFDIKRMEL